MPFQQVTILFLRNALSLLLGPHRFRTHKHGTRGENVTRVNLHELRVIKSAWRLSGPVMAKGVDLKAHEGDETRI